MATVVGVWAGLAAVAELGWEATGVGDDALTGGGVAGFPTGSALVGAGSVGAPGGCARSPTGTMIGSKPSLGVSA